ncbi:MAG TPA: hypothetical protein VHC44_13410 [Verrucomicrobiae bacterium]|nr:hypothetical protein [Verrucomicrobiae bacterium]
MRSATYALKVACIADRDYASSMILRRKARLYSTGYSSDRPRNPRQDVPRQRVLNKTREMPSLFGTRKIERAYRVSYLADSAGRAEAVHFFGPALVPHMRVPDFLDKMPLAKAQAWLDAHPMEERWFMLVLDDERVRFVDADLRRLKFLPELARIHSFSKGLTDAGVDCFRLVPALEGLLIYSPNVTDRCLESLAQMPQLKDLDIQDSPQLTPPAIDQLVARLPNLKEIWRRKPLEKTQE